MYENTAGEFNYRNFTLINTSFRHWGGVQSTLIHEHMHLMLTLQSRYGNLAMMQSRVYVIDKRFLHISKFLNEHDKKMQEGLSVFAEVIFCVYSEGYQIAMDNLQILRTFNKKYYSYVYMLLPLLNFVHENPNSKLKYKINSLDLLNIIYQFAFISMNCKITDIPVEIFKSKKNLKKLVSTNNMSINYIPNRRFKILVRKLIKSLNESDNNTNLEYVIKDVLKDLPYLDENINLIINSNVYLEKYVNSYLKEHKLYFKEIYGDSIYKNDVFNVIDRFNVKKVNSDEIVNYATPQSYKQYPMEKSEITFESILIHSQNDMGIVFVIEDLRNISKINCHQFYIPEEYLTSLQEKLSGDIVTLFSSVKKKKLYGIGLSAEHLECLIEHAKVPIVINYKLESLINEISKLNRTVYIYCDRAYTHALVIINKYTNTRKKAACINVLNKYGEINSLLFVIKLNNNTYFILPILITALDLLYKHIETGLLNIELDNNIISDTYIYNLIYDAIFFC